MEIFNLIKQGEAEWCLVTYMYVSECTCASRARTFKFPRISTHGDTYAKIFSSVLKTKITTAQVSACVFKISTTFFGYFDPEKFFR